MTEQTTLQTGESGDMIRPVSPRERIETVDILRGFAIFGILIVNMGYYNSPVYLQFLGVEWWTGTADRVAGWLIRFFAEGKFYSLFSLLFGLGLMLQMARIESRGVRFVPLYRRRLLVLLLIGLLHELLLWYGDILVPYAILGFLLLLFRNRKPKTIITWVVICLAIPVLLTGAVTVLMELGRLIPQAAAQIEASFAESAANYKTLAEQSLRTYAHGTFSEIMVQRLSDLGFMYMTLIIYAPNIFALFLIGLYVGRRGILHDIPHHLPFIRRVQWWGLALGLLGNFVMVVAREYSNPTVPTPMSWLAIAAGAVGGPAFCLFYCASAIRLVQNPKWKDRLAPLAAVGRTAISNYLFQSFVCTTIFYGYGLGLYGQVGPAVGLLLSIVLFTVQVYVSGRWMQRYQFGPVEWLWRSLTYGKRQPMRIVATSAGAQQA